MYKSNEEPLVSIVIPCYNHEIYVQECIESVMKQDYENIELIIIDDGSKDNSVQKIQAMIPACESRFRRFEFRSRPNKGLCETLNEAIFSCNGYYVVTIASDDKMVETRIRRQVELFGSMPNKVAGIFGSAYIIDEYNAKVSSLDVRERQYSFQDIFLHRHNLPACTQMLRLQYLQAIGPLPSKYAIEDWYMWLAFTRQGYTLVSVPEFFSYYRVHSSNTSSDHELMNSERYKLAAAFGAGEKRSLLMLAYACCDLSASLQATDRLQKIKMINMALVKSLRILFERKFYVAVARVFF